MNCAVSLRREVRGYFSTGPFLCIVSKKAIDIIGRLCMSFFKQFVDVGVSVLH